MTVILSLDGVIKRYAAGVPGCSATVEVLRLVHLQVAHGDLIGIIGPRRSGKTTLLLCAAGLLVPDVGRITWFSDDGTARAQGRDDVRYVDARPPLCEFLTVRETLRYRTPLTPPGCEGLIDDALGRAALNVLGPVAVGRLTKHFRARVAIATALVDCPRVLLVDCLLDGLEAADRHEMMALLHRLVAGGTPVVVASAHHEVVSGATRVVRLAAGALIAVDAPGAAREPAATAASVVGSRVR